VFVAALHICISTSGSCTNGSDPLVTTLLPAVIGALLAFGASLFLRRGERTWQRSRDELARQMQVVTPLDEALVEAQRRVSGVGVPEGESRWDLAHQEWETGWVRLTPHLADGELEERYKVVGTILTEIRLRDDADDGLHAGSPVMIVMRAIGNARIALAYWLRGDALPPASFPSSAETILLLGQGDPKPLAADAPLRTWLAEHEQPPWRPEAPATPASCWQRLRGDAAGGGR
jgi:hypothetical protein